MSNQNRATHMRIAAGLGALAIAWAWSVDTAQACFACSGGGGDFTALGIITMQMDALHSVLTSQMVEAQRGLSQGHLNGALLGMLGLGFLYGGLHALGPGHGKVALGAHAAATGEGWRGYVLASLIASLGHVVSAALAVGAVLMIFQGVLSDADMMRRVIVSVAGLGLVLVGGMLLFTGGHLHFGRHAHGPAHAHVRPQGDHHAHAHGHAAPSAGLLAIAMASALVPCTSSMLVLMYGAANGFIILGLVVVLFIALGQAVTQTGAAFAGLGLRSVFAAAFGPGVLRLIAAAAGVLILIVGLAAIHAAVS